MTRKPIKTCKAAHPKGRAIEAIKNCGAVALVLVVLWATVATVYFTWKESREDQQFRDELIAASNKSPAYSFLVKHWLECNRYKQTRAGCYAAIREAAGTQGEEFVQQVDAAAKELNLL